MQNPEYTLKQASGKWLVYIVAENSTIYCETLAEALAVIDETEANN